MAKKKKHGGRRAGSGRKVANPEGKTIPVVARVPEKLMTKLDSIAEENEWNRSQAVTEAIRDYVDK